MKAYIGSFKTFIIKVFASDNVSPRALITPLYQAITETVAVGFL